MYRQSYYNYFVPYQDNKVIYYNALTRNSFVMSQSEHERIQSKFGDPISFELGFPTVFRQFREWGFFVKEGDDEIAPLRFRYNKDVLFSTEVHIILSVTNEVPAMEKYTVIVKKNIEHLLAKMSPSLLCLEWSGNEVLAHYAESVVPISDYAYALCKQYDIPLRLQMLIDGAIQDKEEFNPKLSAHDKLLVRQVPKSPSANNLFPTETDLDLTDWSVGNHTDNEWYPVNSPRLYQYTILGNGDVCCGRQEYGESVILGKLLDDGTIEWDEQQRMQLLGSPWFETERCRQCKHLYLLSSICPKMRNVSKYHCCLDLNVITPEKIIIAEFESKEE